MKPGITQGLLGIFILIVITACSPSPPQDAVNYAVGALTDSLAKANASLQSYKLISSKQYPETPADKLNEISDKWCLVFDFVDNRNGTFEDGHTFLSVRKIKGEWIHFGIWDLWARPPVNCPENW